MGREYPVPWKYTSEPIRLVEDFQKFKVICIKYALDDVKLQELFGINSTGRVNCSTTVTWTGLHSV